MDYYFCADSQNVEGPVSATELSELRARGKVVADTQVMRVGTDEWRSYDNEFSRPAEPFDAAALFEPAPALGDPVAPPPLWQPAPIPKAAMPTGFLAPRPTGTAAAPSVPGQPIPAMPAVTTVAPAIASAPRIPWYRRTGWSIVLFYFFSPIMLPLMWHWKLYTLRTRIWVTAGFVCLLIPAFVAVVHDEITSTRQVSERKSQTPTPATDAAGVHSEEVSRPMASDDGKSKRDLPVAGRSSLTKQQWRDKLRLSFDAAIPLIASASKLQQVMGQPTRTRAEGEKAYWYYECSDGTIQLEMVASLLGNGTIQAQIDDYDPQAVAAKARAEKKTAEQKAQDSNVHPLVARVRALNLSNAEDAGVSDGMATVTNLTVNLMQQGTSNYELRRKLANAKSDVPNAYDLVAEMNHLDPSIYANYRRGWVRGFQIAIPQ